ncbi:glycoside hydrolase family 2 TIM barrel-domain containing protein [Microbacterium suaedae]|uniref:glycoside hydrolase family 2 TIM barrel-domain containing protein n=1 Tax=Microbacterium suaedae TaxID=2067813 RepID=UPI000DA15346|nr:glycoside hydrolase family 2 TIM barrel-domain containing protein [Microbacterium suaedae]
MQIARTSPGEGSLPPRARLHSDAPAQSLDGTWRFRVHPALRAAPTGAWDDTDVSSWDTIEVPGHWNLQGHGSPAYSNVQMPFPLDPPHPPDDNPIGDHVLDLDADPALLAYPRQILRFDGVESAAEVRLNGVDLGSTRGSRLTHEFDVTDILRPGANRLAVRVAQFSDATYLEDQDMWWLPGIFRSVTLLARPAGGIRDAFVHADLDPATGRGSLRIDVEADAPARIRIAELGIDEEAGDTIDAGAVEPWSAEAPRLYDAELSTASETVRLRIGFRRVEVRETQILVNGAPIMLRGVNRHEHHPERGRVFDAAFVRDELLLMKRHGINAVRTSHYPPHPDVLDLFDELGFWVIDECDLETHAFEFIGWRGNPSADPRWREAYLDRMRRTVHRDKNHPSVIMWSLGNESHTGRNLDQMALWTKQFDPDRLLHYEGDWSCRHTDVYSRMYAGHDEVRRIGEEGLAGPAFDADAAHARRARLPFLQCEFVHAMGTGPGGMREYWDLFERYPRLAGGFVWEWVEHGIRGDDGRIRYGGDFGERVHDGNFVIDGLVSADREPRPGLTHYAAVIAPVRLSVDAGRASATVENRYDHVDLSHLELAWERVVDGDVVAEGRIPMPACGPRSAASLELPAECRGAHESTTADVLTLAAVTREASPWAAAGHAVGHGQDVRVAAQLADDGRYAGIADGKTSAGADPSDDAEPSTPADPSTGAPSVTTAEPAGATARSAAFDTVSGALTSLGGLAVAGPSVGVWRAPTDNDHGQLHGEVDPTPMADRWRAAGMDRMVTRLVSFDDGDVVRVRTRTGAPILDCAVDAHLSWTPVSDTSVRLDVEIDPAGEWPVDWARLGLDLVLDAAPTALRFAGLGPVSAYPDMVDAARFGWWHIASDELVVDNVRPQESGARQGVVDATIGTDAGALRVRALADPFALTVSPYAREEIARAEHNWDLRADGRTHVSIDLAQSGVGTASCGPGVLPRHRLAPRSFRTSLLLERVA